MGHPATMTDLPNAGFFSYGQVAGNSSVGGSTTGGVKHIGKCLLKGAAVGAVGTLVVAGVAAGTMALGAPAAAVTGVLLLVGGIGGATALYSAGSDIANGNYAGAAYDIGTLAGSAAAGGLVGGLVGDSINPPATRGFSLSRDLGNVYNSALGSVGSWLGTGPDAAASGASTGSIGAGLARILRGGC